MTNDTMSAKARRVPCDKCGAGVGENCDWKELGVAGNMFHIRRMTAASKLPAEQTSPQSLTVAGGEETEKSLQEVMPAGPWRERWYGSEPQCGWSIVAGRKVIAYLGMDIPSESVTAIVYAHNIAVNSQLSPSPATPADPRVWTMDERIAAAKVIHKLRYPSDEEWEREHDAPKWAQRGYDIMTDIAISIQCELNEIKNRGM